LFLTVLFLLCAVFANSFFVKAAFAFLLFLPLLTLLPNLHVRKKLRGSVSVPVTAPKNERQKGTVTIRNGSFFPCRKAILSAASRN
ncbi:hypothetical protein, partial [Klebsiella pneumoniae]|uniref:hypothetical protein n=1 Tax=Klebsiella pneumoniae TaxID=573 RepID=UPI0025A2A5B3